MGTVDEQIAEFAQRVREMVDRMNVSKGKELERLGAELSQYISERVPALVDMGASVADVQKAVRAATDIVPQTYASDADDDTDRLVDISDIGAMMLYVPMDGTVIEEVAAGALGLDGFEDMAYGSPDITEVGMTEGIDMVLAALGVPDADMITFGGDIVTDQDGEGIALDSLELTGPEGEEYSVTEPAVFKTYEEVCNILGWLEQISEKAFLKKANVKDMIKAGLFGDCDERSVRKDAKLIAEMLWEEFVTLRDVYRKAAEQGKGLLIFVAYDTIDGDD